MKRLYVIAVLLAIFITSIHSFSFASEAKNAKAVLIKSYSNLIGEGAVVSGPFSINDIEKENLKKIAECKQCPQVPFGFVNHSWVKFKSQYKAGDVILRFRTNNKSWTGLYGRDGYALIRGDKIIDTLIREMN